MAAAIAIGIDFIISFATRSRTLWIDFTIFPYTFVFSTKPSALVLEDDVARLHELRALLVRRPSRPTW